MILPEVAEGALGGLRATGVESVPKIKSDQRSDWRLAGERTRMWSLIAAV